MKKENRISSILLIIAMAVISILITGCWHTGQLISETMDIDLNEALEVNATIVIYKGNLEIKGISQSALLTSNFSYNLERWFPRISYMVENGIGNLKITQDNEKSNTTQLVNNWLLLFNSMVPLSLDIIMGSAESHLNLNSINLTDLKAAIGTGDTVIDLTGDYHNYINIYLLGGIGHTTLNLSRGVKTGILIEGTLNRIKCDKDFHRINNYYFNSTSVFEEKKINITIFSGIGIIEINLI